MREIKSFRLVNFPMPRAEIAGLVVGIVLEQVASFISFSNFFVINIFGWLLFSGGILFVGWAIFSADTENISNPRKLVIDGAYCRSRNPMVLGWMGLYLGMGFLFDSPWIVFIFPAIFAYNHYVEIKREEEALLERFGPAYEEYCKRAPRYL